MLAAAAAAAPGADGWLIGAGWRSERWPAGDPQPHRDALDAACGDRPVLLWAHDHHTAWLSSAALARLPVGSAPVVERDGAGEPTGVLRETAAWDAAAAIPPPGEHELDDGRRSAGLREAHARGVTGIHDFQREHGLAVWQRLNAERLLSLRVWASLPAERLDEIVALGLRSGLGDEWLRIGPVKAFADGTLGSRTAWMLEPFADAGRGESLLSAEELRELAGRCADAGLDSPSTRSATPPTAPCWTRSRRRAERWEPRGLRPRIEHAQLLHPDDLARFAELGVTASMQPSHAPSDRPVAEAVWGARCAGAYALGSLAASGAALCFGSDAPIEPLDPLAGVQAAVDARLAGRRGARRRARARRLLERRGPRPARRAAPRSAAARLRGRPRRARARPRHLSAGRDRRHRRRRDDGRRPLGARAAAMVTAVPLVTCASHVEGPKAALPADAAKRLLLLPGVLRLGIAPRAYIPGLGTPFEGGYSYKMAAGVNAGNPGRTVQLTWWSRRHGSATQARRAAASACARAHVRIRAGGTGCRWATGPAIPAGSSSRRRPASTWSCGAVRARTGSRWASGCAALSRRSPALRPRPRACGAA